MWHGLCCKGCVPCAWRLVAAAAGAAALPLPLCEPRALVLDDDASVDWPAPVGYGQAVCEARGLAVVFNRDCTLCVFGMEHEPGAGLGLARLGW